MSKKFSLRELFSFEVMRSAAKSHPSKFVGAKNCFPNSGDSCEQEYTGKTTNKYFWSFINVIDVGILFITICVMICFLLQETFYQESFKMRMKTNLISNLEGFINEVAC